MKATTQKRRGITVRVKVRVWHLVAIALAADAGILVLALWATGSL